MKWGAFVYVTPELLADPVALAQMLEPERLAPDDAVDATVTRWVISARDQDPDRTETAVRVLGCAQRRSA
jgi:hypothetical protein